MKFGATKTVNSYGEDGQVSDIALVHESENIGNYKQFKVRHLVHSPQERTLLYSKFVNELDEKRVAGTLIEIKDEPSTRPSFTWKFPKNDVDGSYIVFTSWTEKL